MPAMLLISFKLILFAMEMGDKTRTQRYKTTKALRLVFPQKKIDFL